MLQILKVTGNSMAYKYLDGDFVLILKSPFFKYFLKEKRDLVFNKAPYGIMIKSIEKIDKVNKKIDLKGLNNNSIDKKYLKDVPYNDVLGIVIKKF